jgi:glucosyl-3-phosphoglycerate synthase
LSDFHQTELIATLHRLNAGAGALKRLEDDLRRFVRACPTALVLPCLYEELKREALQRIVAELKGADYLQEIVVSLNGASEEDFLHARAFFAGLGERVTILWHESPRVASMFAELESNGLFLGAPGKGRAIWIAEGYVLAKGTADVIAFHDCDIRNYSKELLARLIYPVVSPDLDYAFSKGYYARVAEKMYGRVMRLFFTPFVRATRRILGESPFLEFLDSFRYALSGEFAMTTDLARLHRIPVDWGLEVGILSEVYRKVSSVRVCQVEVCETYEHKHKEVSHEDPTSGLLKMSIEIAKMLFRSLAIEGVMLTKGFFDTLMVVYLRSAQDAIKRYSDDSAINGLSYDRHAEELAAETFAQAIRTAGEAFLEDPAGTPLIPNWSRVTSAIPDFQDRLREAIEADNA